MKKHESKCSCGNIEYCFEGDLINSAFCYCHECQTHTGSEAASTLISNNDFSPKMAIYTASAPKWAVFPEGVPKYDTLPPGLGG